MKQLLVTALVWLVAAATAEARSLPAHVARDTARGYAAWRLPQLDGPGIAGVVSCRRVRSLDFVCRVRFANVIDEGEPTVFDERIRVRGVPPCVVSLLEPLGTCIRVRPPSRRQLDGPRLT